jgi:uncharacterized protein (DUF2147 family)
MPGFRPLRPHPPSLAAALAVGLCAAGAPLAGAEGDSPIGRWLTEGGDGVIDIEPCGAALCGRIVGIELDHPGDPMPRDYKGRPQCGLTIIHDAVKVDDAWEGHITDPRNGNVYRARLRMAPDGRLHLRGYLLIPLLGSTQIWTRYEGMVPSDCRLRHTRPLTPPDQHA